VVPLATTELYPFSRAPMFADAPQLYCDYAVYSPDGRQITDAAVLTKLGVQRNYWGNPLGVGVGYAPPPSVDEFGAIAGKDKVVEMAAARLERFPDWEYVTIVQTVFRPTDDGRVAGMPGEAWRVDNPYYKVRGAP
jgi:hypothetical protein